MGMTNTAVFADGYDLPLDGFHGLLNGGSVHNVPLVIGSTKDEVKLFLWFSGEFRWDSEQYQSLGRFSSELWKADGVDSIARALTMRSGQAPVYAYLFGWGTPDENGESPLPGNWPLRLGSFHTLDIPFFLGTDTINGLLGSLWFSRRNRASRENLSDAMIQYLASFVHSGNPNTGNEGLPEWEAWSNGEGAPKSILFDVDGDRADITMTDREYTGAAIHETMRSELSATLYSEVVSRLRPR